jgi:L-fuconolactonase
VIDSHHHFWAYDERDYDWMTDGMDVLRRDHLPHDLAPLLARAGVVGTVAVQARRTEVETAWLLGLADAHPFVRGVVGWIDMAAPDVEARLERFARHPRLVGMREVLHDMPDPDHAASPQHVRAVGAIGRAGLAYDLLLKPPNLDAAIRLVDRFPEGRFVVDHIAKPDMRASRRGPDAEAGRRAWAEGLRALAARPNVACKLSGLVTECDWATWRAGDVAPFLDVVLDAFGAQRCMIGSDWPVCTLAAPYGAAIGLVADYAAALSPHERAAVLGATATRWYRLTDPPKGEA